MDKGRSRTAATSKMEHFVITVNCYKSLTIITKSSIVDVAAVLYPPLKWIKTCYKDKEMSHHQNVKGYIYIYIYIYKIGDSILKHVQGYEISISKSLENRKTYLKSL